MVYVVVMSIPVPPVPSFPPSPITLTSVRRLRAAGVTAGIKASGLPDVALLVSDGPMREFMIETHEALLAAIEARKPEVAARVQTNSIKRFEALVKQRIFPTAGAR